MVRAALSHAPLQGVSAGPFLFTIFTHEGAPLTTKLDAKRWSKFVRIQLGGVEKRENIYSTRAAAECLLRNWPTDWGPQHRNARTACVAVLKEEQPPEFARQAFIEAAREAGILVDS
jgi:hypothetical protein